ncbi:MAG TPA: FkbM family methyltransferase [Ignavibacteria bacterium]|nr:FkbM family methyltransferase [Ignavibacteria bacterium]
MIKKIAKKLGLHKNAFVLKAYQKILEIRYNIPNQDGVVCDIVLDLKIKNWNPTTGGMARSIYLNHVFEQTVTKFFLSKLKPDMCVIDVGSDNGYYSIIFGKLVGDRGKVISFEPIPWAYERTLENVKLNNLNNVVVNNFALSDENGFAFMIDPGNDSRISTNSDAESILGKMEIKLEKFDDYLLKNPEKKIDFIKIDCEGAEMNILLGMKDVIDIFNPKFLVEIHREKLKLFDKTEVDIFNFMEGQGYKHEIINKVDGGIEEYHVYFYKNTLT